MFCLLKAFLILLISLAAPGNTAAAEDLELTAQKIFAEVKSPFCPGRVLSDCPSSSASKLKNEIRDLLAAGKTPEEVYQQLYTIYGNEISAVPQMSGFGLVAWIAPFAFLIFGMISIYFWLRSVKGTEAGEEEDVPEEVSKRIKEELQA